MEMTGAMSFADFCNAPVEVKVEEPAVSGVSQDNGFTDIDSVVEQELMSTSSRPKVSDILGVFSSGIGLDISKNHTGIAMWRNGKLETYGFAVDMEYDKNSYLAEARMRQEFKQKLKEVLQGYKWEVCIVEDVYGGTNFETTRKLLALNCVVDELVLEGSLEIDYIYRFKEAEWLKSMRQIAKFGNKLNPKYECQKILEYLDFDFYLKYKDSRKKEQAEVFFEDICDATGQLLGLAMRLNSQTSTVKSSSVKMRDLKLFFFEDAEDVFDTDDDILRYSSIVSEDFPEGDIEECLLNLTQKHPNDAVSILVNTSALGIFGVKNGFTFYEQGYGYLVFYNKKLLKSRR